MGEVVGGQVFRHGPDENGAMVMDSRLRGAGAGVQKIREDLKYIPTQYWGLELREQSLKVVEEINRLEALVELAEGRREVATAKAVLHKWEGKL